MDTKRYIYSILGASSLLLAAEGNAAKSDGEDAENSDREGGGRPTWAFRPVPLRPDQMSGSSTPEDGNTPTWSKITKRSLDQRLNEDETSEGGNTPTWKKLRRTEDGNTPTWRREDNGRNTPTW